VVTTPRVAIAQWSANGNNIYFNSGTVGIGINATSQKLVVSANSSSTLPAPIGVIHLFGADGAQPTMTIDGFAAAPVYLLRRANTTGASPSALQANDPIGVFGVAGYGSNAYQGTRARVGFFASENWTNSANGTYLTFNTTANGAATVGGTERMRIDNAGNVGIGTTSPPTKLSIQPVAYTTAVDGIQFMSSDNTTHSIIQPIKIAAGAMNLYLGSNSYVNTTGGHSRFNGSAANASINVRSSDGTIRFNTNTSGGSALERMQIDSIGNVGIGMSPTGNKLDVFGSVNATGFKINGAALSLSDLSNRSADYLTSGTLPDARFPSILPQVSGANLTDLNAARLASGLVSTARLGSGTANATTFLRGDNTWAVPAGSTQWENGGSNSIYYSNGKVGIGISGPSEALEVSGNLKVSGTGTGNITATGTIEATNVKARFQDVAEWVPSSEQIAGGTVVVLDSTKSNQVISSSRAYDTRVAGVISEQPGIALGEGGAGKVLVATTGRVLVNVDASRGPIQIGDLLVTSDVLGAAMKSEPVNVGGVQLHRPGTLIGKALEPLEKGKGKILVLLSLQ